MEFIADVTKVCEFLGIEAGQFNSLTVAQIEEAKWGIEVAEIEARRNNKSIMEKYRYFFQAYDTFVSYFGKEVTDKYLPVVPLEKIAEEETVRKGTGIYGRPAILIGQGEGYFPIRRGRGSRSGVKEFAPADIYEASSQFQGLCHKEIVFAIFAEIYPWMDDFDVSVYELRSGEGIHEFYVATEGEKSLYVPYKCFVNGDVEGILNRNKEYLGWFNRFGDKADNAYKELIQTPTVKRFLEVVEGNSK